MRKRSRNHLNKPTRKITVSSERAAKVTQAEKEKNIGGGFLGRVVRGDVWEEVTQKQRAEDAVV